MIVMEELVGIEDLIGREVIGIDNDAGDTGPLIACDIDASSVQS